MICDYEKQVYTSLLGKVIGVYMGRPVEGWKKERIQEQFGTIDHYVSADLELPLVVSDDDISGTLTFIRALKDSGSYEKTPDVFFGENWLNYLIPGQTILWWGNMCHSTEHTAYVRLKQGYRPPESGSARLNGKEVSEQIGAQIFIDCFGMVAPGNPALAAELAEKAARVSHDGEAVYAAIVVAVMVSLAFVEKDMNKILDEAVKFIPGDSLIARIHRDVRHWAGIYPDWNDTFARISDSYGYSIYGGNCHVVPNHAVMVMAWAYGGNDFCKSMCIVNTAGWDTDCNAANVGAVTALVAGLEHLCDSYDFRSPFADRIYIPTADGTYSVTDVLEQALYVADIGRKVMKMPDIPLPKNGAKYHFEMDGALHGFMGNSETVHVCNEAAPENFQGTHCLRLTFSADGNGGCAETPLAPQLKSGNYRTPYTPVLYNGNTLQIRGMIKGQGCCRFYLELSDGQKIFSSRAVSGADGMFEMTWKLEFSGTADKLGVEYVSENPGGEALLIDSIAIGGTADVSSGSKEDYEKGWISSMAAVRGAFSNDPLENICHFICNAEPGVMVIGNREWKDLELSTSFKIHSADRSGIIFHYQGLSRWIGVIFTRNEVMLIKNFYGEKILARREFVYEENMPMELVVKTTGPRIDLFLEGEKLFTAEDEDLVCGGAGIYCCCGVCGVSNMNIKARI